MESTILLLLLLVAVCFFFVFLAVAGIYLFATKKNLAAQEENKALQFAHMMCAMVQTGLVAAQGARQQELEGKKAEEAAVQRKLDAERHAKGVEALGRDLLAIREELRRLRPPAPPRS